MRDTKKLTPIEWQMRIVPQGIEEWLQPCGAAMQVLAGFMLAIGLLGFGWRMYDLATWSTVQGEIISAELTRQSADDGQTLCSATYKLRYIVKGKDYVISKGFASATSDCAAWQQQVQSLPGNKEEILYDPGDPGTGYVRRGRTTQFFLVAVVCCGLALVFAVAGMIAKRLGQFMEAHGIAIP